MTNVKDRFLRLIRYNTQSNHESKTSPSTKNQLDFARILADECVSIGMNDVYADDFGYVYAYLPSNIHDFDRNPVTVGFIAHMDTTPDSSGENVEGISVKNYDGGDIFLNSKLKLSPVEYPHLKNYTGCELIVTNGKTLLGADDKAGIAEILTAVEYLIKNPNIKHVGIKVCFTPDEEIGRGADNFDVKGFGADFAYTVDGGEIGEIEYENFYAARADIEIIGKSIHPGYAKGIMINAGQIAAEFSQIFPQNETPAATGDREGFYHMTSISGNVERANINYIIRDFDKNGFEKRKRFLRNVVQRTNLMHGRELVKLDMRDEYSNMREKLEDKMYIVDLACRAMECVGVAPKIKAIRGGTDGSRLSFMGLPCPNIFTGGHNFHGHFEYIPVESMIKACDTIVKISELAAEIISQ